MPKFYVKHKDLTLLTDEINSENAAARMMLLLEDLNTKSLIYVDERGYRTKNAEYKYSIVKTISRRSNKPVWYLKIKK